MNDFSTDCDSASNCCSCCNLDFSSVSLVNSSHHRHHRHQQERPSVSEPGTSISMATACTSSFVSSDVAAGSLIVNVETVVRRNHLLRVFRLRQNHRLV